MRQSRFSPVLRRTSTLTLVFLGLMCGCTGLAPNATRTAWTLELPAVAMTVEASPQDKPRTDQAISPPRKLHILVTNDDGIDSSALFAVARDRKGPLESDSVAYERGYITVVPIRADWTDEASVNALRSWPLKAR